MVYLHYAIPLWNSGKLFFFFFLLLYHTAQGYISHLIYYVKLAIDAILAHYVVYSLCKGCNAALWHDRNMFLLYFFYKTFLFIYLFTICTREEYDPDCRCFRWWQCSKQVNRQRLGLSGEAGASEAKAERKRKHPEAISRSQGRSYWRRRPGLYSSVLY